MSERGAERARENATGLFTFLKEFAELRMKAIRTVDDYENTLLFSEVPRESECYSAAWSSSGEESGHEDIWLEIRKPRLVPPPQASDQLRPWLNEEELNDSSLDMPPLRPEISQRIEDEHEAVSFLTLRIEDHPGVRTAWEKFVEEKWWPWAQDDRRKQAIQKSYSTLFAIQQRQLRLGEQYEVVLGLGLLSWVTPSGHIVRRHLVCAQTSLEFEAARGIVRVGPAGEGARLRLEQDMLDLSDRPAGPVTDQLETELGEIGDNVWERGKLASVLGGWVHAVSAEGKYSEDLAPQARAGNDPSVHLAPMLVLRRRTERSFVQAFKDIAAQLANGASIPAVMRHFVAPPLERSHDGTDPQVGKQSQLPEEVYFPLESNEQQREIVSRLASNTGVVVQGPPGTGKSHTIVNLVCHLLAMGQRVLITSQGPRALRVLRRFLADRVSSIAPLTVTLLGDDRESLEAMEMAVQGIMDRHNQWDERANDREIARYDGSLVDARQLEARLLTDLLAIRELETYEHTRNGYTGTLSQIADNLRLERQELDWVPDAVAEDQEVPISNSEALDLLAGLRSEELQAVWGQAWVPLDPARASPPGDFETLVRAERQSRSGLDEHQEAKRHPAYGVVGNLPEEARKELRATLAHVSAAFDRIRDHPYPWVSRMVAQVLSRSGRAWEQLHATTLAQVALHRDRAAWADRTPVLGLDGRDRATVKFQAEEVLKHFRRHGPGWGVGLWRPQALKEGLYLRDEVRVGGRKCDGEEGIVDLVQWLEVEAAVAGLQRTWAPQGLVQSATFAGALEEFAGLAQPIEETVGLCQQKDAVVSSLAAAGIAEPTWTSPASLRALIEVFDAAERQRALGRIETVFNQISRGLQNEVSAADADAAALLACVRGRDPAGYSQAYAKIDANWRAHGRRVQAQSAINRASATAPLLVRALLQSPNDPVWDSRLAGLDSAWRWARTNKWIRRLADPGEDQRLRVELDAVRVEVRTALQGAAAARAWKHCFARLQANERQHLVAWSQAIRRIGKGTGKFAPLHRRTAKEHMDQCRSAIPVWIMPLYRIAEGIKPGDRRFDVAIIDEASQSGPDALLLTYLADKVVVVGDDKQISPDHVGLNRSDVLQLQQHHLQNMPHAQHYGADYSFFDVADIVYPGRVRLTEHFRCMPEIIQFSNSHFYKSPPLVPLRQYGAGRLDPVVSARLVEGATVKTTGSRVINELEAKAIVDEIVRSNSDPRYGSKSFGVISLQGPHQAHLIEQELLKRVDGKLLEKRQVVCGDSYAFQGDERDVIFLSMVAAPTAGRTIGVLNKESDQRRFNVAASRARDQMILFHSVTVNDLSPSCLRYDLLKYCLSPSVSRDRVGELSVAEVRHSASVANRNRSAPPSPFDSWFEVDVWLRIVDRGYRVMPQVEVGGFRIDLVVEGMKGRLAVECDGDQWHGIDRHQQDMTRQRTLERAGWRFWRIRGSAFALDSGAAMEDLWASLERNGILPQGVSSQAGDDTSPQAPEPIAPAPVEPRDPTASGLHNGPAAPRTKVAVGQSGTYAAWPERDLLDPREAAADDVVAGIGEIVGAEGPVVAQRVVMLYTRAAGLQRAGRIVRGALLAALKRALKAGLLLGAHEFEEQDEMNVVLRLPGTPRVLVRSRGPRDFDELPPFEMSVAMARISQQLAKDDFETLSRLTLERFELVRMTSGVERRMRWVHSKMSDALAVEHDVV